VGLFHGPGHYQGLEPDAFCRWCHVSLLALPLLLFSIANTSRRSSEAQLRALFNQFGLVQTCIVNVDKRHAFIKMINRMDAMKARDGMETYKSGDMQLRVRFKFLANSDLIY
jgi:hypothetical protein